VKYINSRLQARNWLPTARMANDHYGLLIRSCLDQYVTQPANLSSSLVAAVQKLNVEIAFTMKCDITEHLFDTLDPADDELYVVHDRSQLQIMDSLADIVQSPREGVKRFQYVCLVRQERLILVWHDSVEDLIPHAAELEGKLLAHVTTI